MKAINHIFMFLSMFFNQWMTWGQDCLFANEKIYQSHKQVFGFRRVHSTASASWLDVRMVKNLESGQSGCCAVLLSLSSPLTH